MARMPIYFYRSELVSRPKKRMQRSRPLLVPAFGIGFPGDPGSRRKPEKLVQYRVNMVWMKKNVLLPEEEEEEAEEESLDSAAMEFGAD